MLFYFIWFKHSAIHLKSCQKRWRHKKPYSKITYKELIGTMKICSLWPKFFIKLYWTSFLPKTGELISVKFLVCGIYCILLYIIWLHNQTWWGHREKITKYVNMTAIFFKSKKKCTNKWNQQLMQKRTYMKYKCKNKAKIIK